MLINIANVSSYSTKPTLTFGANNLAKIPKTENDRMRHKRFEAIFDNKF